MFKCSKSTATAARVHHILFGRGGVSPPSLKFTCQCVSQETLDQLTDFLLQDDISQPSSCRSVVVNGEESPVQYWQSSIRDVIQQYLVKFPGGVKRSFIYTCMAMFQRTFAPIPCLLVFVICAKTMDIQILQA